MYVDYEQWTRLLLNLTENALLYAPPESEVRVGAEAWDGAVMLYVEDDGPGVPPEEREHVFDKFYRGTVAGGRAPSGTGLGLAIAREIVTSSRRDNQGDVVVSDGARFVVTVPDRETCNPPHGRHRHDVDPGTPHAHPCRRRRGADQACPEVHPAHPRLRGHGGGDGPGGPARSHRRPAGPRHPRPRACRTCPAWTCAASCARGLTVPILILSVRANEADKVDGAGRGRRRLPDEAVLGRRAAGARPRADATGGRPLTRRRPSYAPAS